MKLTAFHSILIALAMLIAPAARAVEIIVVASGNWSSTTTWGGGVLPGIEDDVKIPTGLTVTLNTNVECGGIIVEGKLTVERANRLLATTKAASPSHAPRRDSSASLPTRGR